MTVEAVPELMTTAELMALPHDDRVDRELIRGQLRERAMTRRNRKHCRTTTRIAKLLEDWLERQPEPRGEVLTGEIGVRLRRNPDTTVGIDVAYISPETVSVTPDDAVFVDGPPVLAVEILSPSDPQEDILDKVREYLDAGVRLVWVAEPVFRTVTVYRPEAEPALFSASQHIDGGHDLPGFRAVVADLFG